MVNVQGVRNGWNFWITDWFFHSFSLFVSKTSTKSSIHFSHFRVPQPRVPQPRVPQPRVPQPRVPQPRVPGLRHPAEVGRRADENTLK